MTRPPNNAAKSTQEYHSVVQEQQVNMLIIRLTPGMEALAQEMSTGQRIYEQQWLDPNQQYSPAMPPLEFRPYQDELVGIVASPPQYALTPSPAPGYVEGLPFLHASPLMQPTQRMRSQHWVMDGTGAFPTLIIAEDRVGFYSNPEELRQALAERFTADAAKIYLNLAHVVSIEKILATQVLAQNLLYTDVNNGVSQQIPSLNVQPLAIGTPSTLPVPTHIYDEMIFKINPTGGQAPYKFAMIGQPPDIYVTTDGWVRGYIDEAIWPTSGTREFLIRILVQDSAVPRASAILDYRFRIGVALP